ncbi:MAG: hypothetical protein ABID45_02275 [Patescibacteria group bacterium]
MAKPIKKKEARNLRRKGNSIKDIADKLKVSKGTVSLWCSDIKLSNEHIRLLEEKMKQASYIGRMKGAETQKKKRIDKINYWEKEGEKKITQINNRELLLIGLALYWGEGGKTERKISFSNSDPEIIELILKWFRELFHIPNENFRLQIGINYIHKKRINDVQKYWKTITGLSHSQFQKASFKKTKNIKTYDNINQHYGTLRITIIKSSDLFYQVSGLIKAINKAV